ncbi:MAG: Ribosome-associated ATPase [Holosporales bacterium]
MIIKVKDLNYQYGKNPSVFSNVNFEIPQGEFWGVLGKNGAGKTTLMDLLLGVKSPKQGEIFIFGDKDFAKRDMHHPQISYLSQDIVHYGELRIDEILRLHSHFFKNYSKDYEKWLLKYFELEPDIALKKLSTGQKKKVQIISSLASQTELLLIDEITAVLDPEARHKFFKLLLEFKDKRSKTILIATNIVEDLKERVDRFIYINNNHVTVEPSTVLNTIFHYD